MSVTFANPMMYWCNVHGCGAKEFSPSGELPEGWEVWEVIEVLQGGDPPVSVVRHKCPKCKILDVSPGAVHTSPT